MACSPLGKIMKLKGFDTRVFWLIWGILFCKVHIFIPIFVIKFTQNSKFLTLENPNNMICMSELGISEHQAADYYISYGNW